MKPWEIYERDKPPNDAEIILAWYNFKPRDFLFGVKFDDRDDTTIVAIVPREYFEEHKKLFHDSIPVVVKDLPDGLIETFQGLYETDDNIDYVRLDMMGRGFSFSSRVNELMDKMFSFEYGER